MEPQNARPPEENAFAKQAWLMACGTVGTSTNKALLGYQAAVVADEVLGRFGFHFDRLGETANQALYVLGDDAPEALVKVEIDFALKSMVAFVGARCGDQMQSKVIGSGDWLDYFYDRKGVAKWAELDHELSVFISDILETPADGEEPESGAEEVPSEEIPEDVPEAPVETVRDDDVPSGEDDVPVDEPDIEDGENGSAEPDADDGSEIPIEGDVPELPETAVSQPQAEPEIAKPAPQEKKSPALVEEAPQVAPRPAVPRKQPPRQVQKKDFIDKILDYVFLPSSR